MKSKTEYREIPLVSRLKSMRNAFRLVHNPIPVVQETVVELGKLYYFHMGGKTRGLMSQDIGFSQHVLQKNHKNYHKSKLQSKELASYVGKGLLTNNGNSWLRQRRLIQPAFGKKNIESLSILIEEEAALVLARELNESNTPIHVGHLTAMITFHIVARAIFSNEVSYEQIVAIRDRVERVQKMLILQVRQPYKRWYYHLIGKIKKHHILADETRAMVSQLALNRKQSGMQREDILQFLLDVKYEDNGEHMSQKQLTDELIILMVAGHETTAHSLTWTLFLLNQHQEVYRQLESEIDENGRNYMSYFSSDSLLLAVIKESMRLFPPAWVIDRVALEEDIYEDLIVPKDTIIMNFVYGMHRDPELWKNPDDFIPSRFMSDAKPQGYFPFGAGPRLCIGSHFTYLELVITLVQMISNYKIQEEKIEFPGIRPLITLQPAKDIYLSFEKK